MKPIVSELLRDLKAATLIGDPESITAAIDQIRAADDNDLPPSALFPIGEGLAKLDLSFYLPLLGDEDAAVRGAAAAATALAWLAGKEVNREALDFAADDPVYEVRSAYAKALSTDPEKAKNFVRDWLSDESDFKKQTALQVIAQFSDPDSSWIEKIAPLDRAPDHELRAVLVETVNALAAHGLANEVMNMTEEWATRPEPNVWVISRTLSASWTKAYSQEAMKILTKLAETVGEIRPILRAMDRHRK
jgi:hypothetical protein